MKKYQLDDQQASQLLEGILERCEIEPNTIPLDTFLSYSNYRKEKYAVQKRTLIIMMVLFLLLPFCFLPVTMNVSKKDSNYLTLYECKVDNKFPIKKMSAVINNQSMSIFETSDDNYVIKATKNGSMVVTTELWNGQKTQQIIKVSDCDENAPQLLDYQKDDKYIYIYVSDDGTGINYDNIYSIDSNNKRTQPAIIDKEANCIVFTIKECDIYIPDNAGNKLHISMN